MEAVWVRRATLTLMIVAVALGVGLRVQAFARNPSFWIDEAMLALNVVHKPIPELLQPLDLNQGAPVGYLVASKLMMRACGDSEASFRVISLVAGLAGLLIFARFSHAALPEDAARLGTSLFALSPYLVSYSAEFKQYELDAALAVGLLHAARPVWLGTATVGRQVWLAVAGMTAVWFSHPAVFVLAGVGAAIGVESLRGGDRRVILSRVAIGAAWAASFAACWLGFTRKLGMNPYLLDYWAGQFAPLPPTRPGDFAWIAHHCLELFDKPGGFASSDFGAGGLAALCWCLGVVALRKEERPLLIALTLPLVLVFFASGLKKYPFAGRLMLFAVPMLLVLVSRGAAVLVERVRGLSPWLAPLVVGLLLLPGVAECWWHVKEPLHAEEAREVVRQLEAVHQPGEAVYVYYGAVPAFAYYAWPGPIPREDVTLGGENRNGDARRFYDELRPLLAEPRVWVVLAHRQKSEEAAIRAYLDASGRCTEVARRTAAVLLRYESYALVGRR